MIIYSLSLRNLPLLACLAMIVLTTCGKDSPTKSKPPEPPPVVTPVATRVDISPSSATLNSVGQTVQLVAKVFDQNNTLMSSAVVTWTSSEIGVAMVTAQGLVTSVKNGVAQINARAGDTSATATVTVVQVANRITITPPSATLMSIGETFQLTASVLDQIGQSVADAEVEWSSSDDNVAAVDDQGLVTAVMNGAVQINARAGNASATATVTVAQVANRITITPPSATLMSIGETFQLTASVLDQNGQSVADAEVEWSSSDDNVAAVDDQGLVTAVMNGAVQINARAGNASATATVTVAQVANRITITPPSATLMSIGETFQLTASVLDQNGQSVADAEVEWSSSDDNVAAVDDQGLVTAVMNGAVQINARVGNASATATVTVAQVANRITITPPSATLMSIGETFQLTASVLDQNGQPVADAQVNWSSSDDNVAVVNATALVTAVMNGTAVISAEADSETASVGVTVLQAPGSILIVPENVVLTFIGETAQLNASVLDLNLNRVLDANVEWESSKPGVAPVNEQGLVTAVMNGDTRIVARSGDVAASVSILVLGPGSDREVLAEIYKILDGSNWYTGTNWNTSVPLEEWFGVTTNKEGRVTELNLGNNNLRGVLPPETGHLVYLEGLALDSNRLTGAIPPEIGLLTNLTHLYLYDNQLSDAVPHELGDLTNLLHLCLDRNLLTGSVPQELSQLKNLKWLHLYDNFDLSGPLPESITGLSLSALLLQRTQVCAPMSERFREWLGTIHDTRVADCGERNIDRDVLVALYNATYGSNWINNTNWLSDMPLGSWHGVYTDRNGRVVRLSLHSNNLTGTLPPELGQLTQLYSLYLSDNQLTGNITPNIGGLKNLKQLLLGANRFYGSIPPELAQLTKLVELKLNNNLLTGSIPPDLGQLTNLVNLRLTNNLLTGSIPPDLGQLSNLTSLWLDENNLTGSIPPELGQLSNLTSLWLDENKLSGSIPPELGQMSNLRQLSLSNNVLTGSIPPELGQLSNLRQLRLSNNVLTGSIPPELGQLSNLSSLRLNENKLSGSIPHEIGRLSNLTNLGLSNNQLTGDIPPELWQLDKIELISLPRNQLTGSIPPDIGRMSSLRVLSIGENRLLGNIPTQLGQLSNLAHIWIAGNQLTGEIPPELGRLSNLESLLLASNRLSGSVPPELGNLTNLTELDLTRNESLNGALPVTLTNLVKLRGLSILETQLCVPTDEAFQDWLGAIIRTEVVLCEDESADKDVLVTLYNTTGGSTWHNNTNWLSDQPLSQWYGVTAGHFGRVENIDLRSNNLRGTLPRELGNLDKLRNLKLDTNPDLTGALPRELSDLDLESLVLDGTNLCIPVDEDLQAWFQRVSESTIATCSEPSSDREVLVAFYHATDGVHWHNNSNWLSDLPLDQWHGVVTNSAGKVFKLILQTNNLTGEIPTSIGNLSNLDIMILDGNNLHGEIPPSIGKLSNLYTLWLSLNNLVGSIPASIGKLNFLNQLALGNNRLTGSIPPQLGQLANLQYLRLDYNELSGSIPPEFGNLGRLSSLQLSENQLTGNIPKELGQLANLQSLSLDYNELSGSIPPEFGNLGRLRSLQLSENQLTGNIPKELGQLENLESLWASHNQLTGGIPPEFGNLGRLKFLGLGSNPDMSGALPQSLFSLRLEYLDTSGTKLCVPQNADFLAWLDGIPTTQMVACPLTIDLGVSSAYLTQAVQSLIRPVPLVADEHALLRVFLASNGTVTNKPAVQATFYLDGEEVYSVTIPSEGVKIPDKIDESSLVISANSLVPAEVIRPGLEFIVEIESDSALFTESRTKSRLPETGRLAVDVWDMPVLNLTIVPLLWDEDPDFATVNQTQGMDANDDLFRMTRDLLPVQEFQLTVREPVYISTDPAFGQDISELIGALEVIRAMDAASGYYMGVLRTGGGAARRPGFVSISGLFEETVAHELGHNLSLGHAPCNSRLGEITGLDLSFPNDDGNIGAWGYDINSSSLIHPVTPDLMSYCDPEWISDYNFTKALNYRVTDEEKYLLASTYSSPTKSLLLWGGLSEMGKLYLEPAFVVDVPPSLPQIEGPYQLAGLDFHGNTLFRLQFDIPDLADSNGGGAFAFTLPVGEDWSSRLSRITLSGPEGIEEISKTGDRSSALLLDQVSGKVRGILRDWPKPSMTLLNVRRVLPEPGLEVVVSRGIPDTSSW